MNARMQARLIRMQTRPIAMGCHDSIRAMTPATRSHVPQRRALSPIWTLLGWIAVGAVIAGYLAVYAK